jgi:hypothetical protein
MNDYRKYSMPTPSPTTDVRAPPLRAYSNNTPTSSGNNNDGAPQRRTHRGGHNGSGRSRFVCTL